MPPVLSVARVLTRLRTHTIAEVTACNNSQCGLTCTRNREDTHVFSYQEVALNADLTQVSRYFQTYVSTDNDGATWVAGPELNTLLNHVLASSGDRSTLTNGSLFPVSTGDVMAGGIEDRSPTPTAYSANYSGGVLVTGDLGVTWAAGMDSTLWATFANPLALRYGEPTDGIVLAFGDFYDNNSFLLREHRVLRSTDSGVTFDSDFLLVGITFVAAAVARVGTTIFGGDPSWLVSSSDNGSRWQFDNDSPTNPLSVPLTVNGQADEANAGSHLLVLGEFGGWAAMAEDRGHVGYAVTGLAQDPTTETLYGVTSPDDPNDPDSLVTINALTGATTVIGALGATIPDITFTSDGSCWGVGSTAPYNLYSINISTGAATSIGATGIAGTPGGFGIAARPSDDVVFLSPNNDVAGNLYTVDTGTGAATVGAALVSPNYTALAFDPATGTLYGMWMSGLWEGNRYSINTTTGVASGGHFAWIGTQALVYWQASSAYPNGGVFPGRSWAALAPGALWALEPLAATANALAAIQTRSGSSDQAMTVSTDLGMSWTKLGNLPAGFRATQLRRVTADDQVWVVGGSNASAGSATAFAFSYDGGNTWTAATFVDAANTKTQVKQMIVTQAGTVLGVALQEASGGDPYASTQYQAEIWRGTWTDLDDEMLGTCHAMTPEPPEPVPPQPLPAAAITQAIAAKISTKVVATYRP